METKHISINFYGIPLEITGQYYPSIPADDIHPADAAEFDIEEISIPGLPDADPESFFSHFPGAWEELEIVCLEKMED
jgi:hypothetical protein